MGGTGMRWGVLSFMTLLASASVLCTQDAALAADKDGVTFKITAGSPPANPNPAATNEMITVKFKVEFYKMESGHEVVPPNVLKQEYTFTAGDDSDITSVAPDFTVAGNKHSATKTINGGNPTVSFDVEGALKYTQPGAKTVTLEGTVTFNDSSTLHDSVTIDITIADLVVRFAESELRPGTHENRKDSTAVTAVRAVADANPVTITLALDNARANLTAPDGGTFTIPANQVQGETTATVQGVDLSDADQDTHLQAMDAQQNVLAGIPVTVVEPKKWTSSAAGAGVNGPDPPAYFNEGALARWEVRIVFTIFDKWNRKLRSKVWAGDGGISAQECCIGGSWAGQGWIGLSSGTSSTPLSNDSTVPDDVGLPQDISAEVVQRVIMGLDPPTFAYQEGIIIYRMIGPGGEGPYLLDGGNYHGRNYRKVDWTVLQNGHHVPRWRDQQPQ